MATDFSLLIFDANEPKPIHERRQAELVHPVCERWIGGLATYSAALEILSRPPSLKTLGLECWSGVTPEEVQHVALHRYADGATPEEITELAARHPLSTHVWMLERDY